METRANHVLIGSFALATLILAALFALWLGKVQLDREWAFYDVVFEEAVLGLTVGSAVQYSGIQVGEVRALKLAPDDPSHVIARIRVGAQTPVKTDTTARLTFTGLTGVSVIQLGGGSADAERLADPEGGVPKIYAEESALAKLMGSGEDIVLSVNQLLRRASELLSDENAERIAATISHIEALSAEFGDRRGEVGSAIEDIAASGKSLRESLQRLDPLLGKLDSIANRTDTLLAEDASQALADLREATESTRALAEASRRLVENNEAAITRFSQQGLEQVPPTLVELRQTLEHLRQLIQRLESSPAGFLLGADQPKEYDPR
jgi:phospholipid/cholesterol/gamma-HCH transport system substrate-binding protein